MKINMFVNARCITQRGAEPLATAEIYKSGSAVSMVLD